MANINHIVINEEKQIIKCNYCGGGKQIPAKDITVALQALLFGSFIEVHRDCEAIDDAMVKVDCEWRTG